MRERDGRTSLLVRNLPTDIRMEEVRDIFERYGPVRDVYMPKDFHSGRFRGFGFVEFINSDDAEDAERHEDGKTIGGREVSVVFSKQDRKTPREMASAMGGGGGGGGGGYRSPGRRDRGRSRSPRRSYSPPRRGRSRSPPRRSRDSPVRRRRRSPSPLDRTPEPQANPRVRSDSREPANSG